jgi:hypothetical protein
MASRHRSIVSCARKPQLLSLGSRHSCRRPRRFFLGSYLDRLWWCRAMGHYIWCRCPPCRCVWLSWCFRSHDGMRYAPLGLGIGGSRPRAVRSIFSRANTVVINSPLCSAKCSVTQTGPPASRVRRGNLCESPSARNMPAFKLCRWASRRLHTRDNRHDCRSGNRHTAIAACPVA